jgi:peptidoglycan/LPS O-acetylase OafA/YrhL
MNRLSGNQPYLSIGKKAGEIPELDGLRGIAILLVLLRHAAHPIYDEHGTILSIGSWDLATIFMNGWMGVDLFFVLSGFLITHHLLKRWPAHFNSTFMLRYWSKRILRTFPAYYAAVLIAVLGLVPLFSPAVDDVGYSLSIHFLFMQDYLGSDLVAAFWSLGVEEKFYLLCPMVLIVLRQREFLQRIGVLIFLAVLPVVFRVITILMSEDQLINYEAFFWTVRSPFHLAMDGLWIGVICAFMHRNNNFAGEEKKHSARRLCTWSLFVLAGVMIPVMWFDDLYFLPSAIMLNLISFGFGGLLLSVSSGHTMLSGLLRSTWLRVMSVLSYSVYLVHLMLVPLAMDLLSDIVDTSTMHPLLQLLIFLPLFGLLSLIAGAVLHFSVEKPFLILKDKIRI